MEDIISILTDLRRGKLIILTDDKDRENEADLVCAAEKITPAKIVFMATYGRGLICVPLPVERAGELKLPPMVSKNTSKFQCNFTVSVDAKECTTGISAYDRAYTIQRLLNPKTKPHDLHRPGHIFPLIGAAGGVLNRLGHTEGVLDLLRLAHLKPIGVLCEIMGDNGRMLSGKKLRAFGKKHNLKIISIQSLISYLKNI